MIEALGQYNVNPTTSLHQEALPENFWDFMIMVAGFIYNRNQGLNCMIALCTWSQHTHTYAHLGMLRPVAFQ